MRFRILSLIVLIAVTGLLLQLNIREKETVTEPVYTPLLGAVRHPPPYAMKEMSITVHRDRGWPFWHSRGSDHVMAHNAALYLTEDGFPYDRAIPQVNVLRLTLNIVVGIAILMLTFVSSEAVLRWSRRKGSAQRREKGEAFPG